MGTERIIEGSLSGTQIVSAGPPGPPGKPGVPGSVVTTWYFPPSMPDEAVIEFLTSPIPFGPRFKIIVAGHGVLDGIYHGTTTPGNDYNHEAWRIPERVSTIVPDIFVAGGVVSYVGELPSMVMGEWFVAKDGITGENTWKDPVDLSAATAGGGLASVTMVIAAPSAFELGLDGEGNWPINSTFSIFFTNQTNPDNDGIYRGASTEEVPSAPLLRVSDLPEHTTLVMSSIWVPTDELFVEVAANFPAPPLSEQTMLTCLGPFIVAWVDNPFTMTPGWLPITPGWGALIQILETPRISPAVINDAVITFDIGASAEETIVVPWNALEVRVVGTALDPTIMLVFKNPGANNLARFKLWMNLAEPGTIVPPAYLTGSSEPLSGIGVYEVAVVGTGDVDSGDPISVSVVEQ